MCLLKTRITNVKTICVIDVLIYNNAFSSTSIVYENSTHQ